MIVEPAVPEAGVGEIDADDPAERLGRVRTAARQQLEVRRHELGAALLVLAVHGEREQLAVRVRVHVPGRADEVRDVRPPRAVALGDLDRVAEHVGLRLGPELTEAVDGQLAPLATLGVHRVLEAVHRDLTEHRRDLTLEALGEQREPSRRVRGLGEQAAEGDRLAEHRRRLGEGERRRLVEHPLFPRQVGVDAVAELVGERQHVAPAGRPVEQHVRVVRRHRVGAERARALAGAHRRVDPVLVEEAAHDVGEIR